MLKAKKVKTCQSLNPSSGEKRQGGVSLLKHVGRKREHGTRSSRLWWGPAVPPAIDRTAVPAWEGTDGPLCSLMNHTPVMGDVHKHESKGKYIKSAEVYVQGGAWMGCSYNEPGAASLCSLLEGSGSKNITNVYHKMDGAGRYTRHFLCLM